MFAAFSEGAARCGRTRKWRGARLSGGWDSARHEAVQTRRRILNSRTLAIAAVSLLALMVSACNTVRGAGRDVASVGKAVERAVP